MENFYNPKMKYDNLLNRIQKSISVNEGFFLIIKLYLTNNIFYYFLCVIFRFIPLMILVGNYQDTFLSPDAENYNKSISASKWLRKLTLIQFVKIIGMSEKFYIYTCLGLFVLFIIRLVLYLIIFNGLRNKEIKYKWPMPSKYQIIMDHIAFLFYPYILEFLSYIYYIVFTPSKFVIKTNDNDNFILIIMIVLNTLLIIGYNITNYIYFICSNKVYTVTWFEAYENTNSDKYIGVDKPIKYDYSKPVFYIILVLQNFSIIETIELYISGKKIFKIIISCILLLIFLILFFMTIHKYNYTNLINIVNNILAFYCFYSLILDFFIYFFDHVIMEVSTELIYLLVKFLISFLSYISIKIKINRKFLKNNINEILFEEKNKKKNETTLINCLLYLNELMIDIKEKNDVHSAYLLISFFTEHINNCHKVVCNCKILQLFLQKDLNEYKVKAGDKMGIMDGSKGHIPDLIVILNYLYESIFIEYDYYNKYHLSILLSEHFCHLRNNPTIAFSLISSLMNKKKDKLNIEKLIMLYELKQKYIYFITAQHKNNLNKEIRNELNNLLIVQQKEDYFQKYFITLEIAYKIKRIICNYIDNEINILKYKNIFEESMTFKFDENNEEITQVKIKFFNSHTDLKKVFSENDLKKLKKFNSGIMSCSSKNNLFNIITLLKNEEFDYYRITNSIDKLIIFKGLPILLVFKYYLFFDIFEGGKIPTKISSKLNLTFSNSDSLYSNIITPRTITLLIRKLKEQTYQKNSKYYVIFQYKNDFRIKYFNETYALKLGYKQKDLVNEKIDILMPKEFSKSHQNMVKKLLIYDQVKYTKAERGTFFDSTSTIIFTIEVDGVLIYDLSKSYMFIAENAFIENNEYRFMLNNNFDLLALSKNFENEYGINYSIIHAFNLKVIDIFNIKPNKLYKNFSKIFKNIHYQKYIRQAKCEEYFVPQLYVANGDKSTGIMNPNYFNTLKNNILSKIVEINKEKKNSSENKSNNKDEEIENLISIENSQKVINDLFFNSSQINFSSTLKISLSKKKFIENLVKELAKIPDNDLMFEGDKINYNLILSSKTFVQKLLTKKELLNSFIGIQVKLNYFYDKPFYFINVFDKNKFQFNINKSEFILNNNTSPIPNSNVFIKFSKSKSHVNSGKHLSLKSKYVKKPNTSIINNKELASLNISENNNNSIPNNQNNTNMNNNNSINSTNSDRNFSFFKNDSIDEHSESSSSDKILEKMEKYKIKINSDRFITIIKVILFVICICVLIVYILLMEYQNSIIELIHKTFQCYYYNIYTKNLILHFHTIITEKFYNASNININTFTTEEDYDYNIRNITPLLKESFHYFTNLFYDYNLEIDHDFSLMFKKRKFKKLIGFWEEHNYTSEYPAEMDFVIYSIYSILDIDENDAETMNDIENFLFRNGFENRNNNAKVHSNYIKLIYYFIVNYEMTWIDIFNEIDFSIYDNYKKYVDTKMHKYYAFDIIGISFNIIFFLIVIIYLYYSNEIIIKNIIFLFLDFTEDTFKLMRHTNTKIMMIKLFEFKACITDFCLEQLEIYAKNLEKIGQNKNTSLAFSITYMGIDSTFGRSDSVSSDNKSIMSNKDRKSFKKLEDSINKKESLKDAKILIKDDPSISNSSVNYLNRTNSTFLKEKLNNNINSSNLISNSNQNSTLSNNVTGTSSNKFMNSFISKNVNSTNNRNDTNVKSNKLYRRSRRENKSEAKNTIEMSEPIQDIILNKSNKSYILLIKIYTTVTYILMLVIIAYSLFKYLKTVQFHSNFENMFTVFNVTTNRYSLLNYYYNTLKSTIIFPMEEQRKSLENLFVVFEEANEQYEKVVNNQLNGLTRVKFILDLIKDGKSNSTEIMYEHICFNISICERYLGSEYNMIDTGIDFLFKTCLIDVSKIYLDYSNLDDNKNITKIQNLIINNKLFLTGLFLEYAYYYIKDKIFTGFKDDEQQFKDHYINYMGYLNVITIIFSIFSFLFINVFMFVTISMYGDPIKKSTFRISCSFYYIKKYNICIYRKPTT